MRVLVKDIQRLDGLRRPPNTPAVDVQLKRSRADILIKNLSHEADVDALVHSLAMCDQGFHSVLSDVIAEAQTSAVTPTTV